MTEQHVLVGKTITGIQLSDDKEAIRFITTDGDVIGRCDADCCSHTWIESFDSGLRRFPAVVIEASDLDLDREGETIDTESYMDDSYVEFYGFRVTTDQGVLIIDYRNLSNGYYGGSLWWPTTEQRAYLGEITWQDVEGLV